MTEHCRDITLTRCSGLQGVKLVVSVTWRLLLVFSVLGSHSFVLLGFGEWQMAAASLLPAWFGFISGFSFCSLTLGRVKSGNVTQRGAIES